MKKLNAKTIEYCHPEKASELNDVYTYRKTYEALRDLSFDLLDNAKSDGWGHASVVQWARTCGYELHEAPNYRRMPKPLLNGRQKLYTWQGLVNCVLNYMVNYNKLLDNELATFLNEVLDVARNIRDNFNDRCIIDQTEEGVFQVLTDEETPRELFIWRQYSHGAISSKTILLYKGVK